MLFKQSALLSVHLEACTAKPGVPFVILCTCEALSIHFFRKKKKREKKAGMQSLREQRCSLWYKFGSLNYKRHILISPLALETGLCGTHPHPMKPFPS